LFFHGIKGKIYLEKKFNLTTVTLICHCGEPLALSEAKGKRSNLKVFTRTPERELLAMTTFLVVTYHCQIKIHAYQDSLGYV